MRFPHLKDPATWHNASIRTAFQLQWLTLVWMAIAAALAIGAGAVGGSLPLITFGLYSGIGAILAAMRLWHLHSEIRNPYHSWRSVEPIVSRTGASLRAILFAYVVVGVASDHWIHRQELGSFGPGLLVALLSLPVLYQLTRQKLDVFGELGLQSIWIDATENIACGLLAAIAVLVLLADLVMRVPWVDSIAPLGTVWIIGREIQAGWLAGDRYAED